MYEHLFKDLAPTEAETKLIAAAARGDHADFRTGDEDEDDPANAENWGEERNLRAEVIFALLVEGRADWPVHPQGVHVIGANIVGSLDLSGAELAAPVYLIGCRLAAPLDLRDCRAKSVTLSGSHVAGIDAEGLAVAGNLHLRAGFTAKGEVRIVGARVGGDLSCRSARFENVEGYALTADRLDVKGGVFLSECIAKGEVRFLGAKVVGNFDCSEASFENGEGCALNADRLDVKGNIFLSDCTVKGGANFNSATVGGDFDCANATFINPGQRALTLESLRVDKIIWLTFARPPIGSVNLAYVSAGQLLDSVQAWPAAGDLVLVGFEYGAFAGTAPTDWEDRLRWLGLQLESHLKAEFKPQPWEQVVAVLRRMGHDVDARKIAIAKQDALLESGLRSRLWSRLWHGFLGETIKYGYESWRALIWMVVIILIGTVIFRDANRADLIVPAKERVYLDHRYEDAQGTWLPPEYPAFSPLVYAADVFVPILDLHQETHWRPATSKGGWGWAVTIFMWFYILLGWVFTTVAVAGLTGLVRQRAER